MLIIVEHREDRFLIDITERIQKDMNMVDLTKIGYGRYPFMDQLTGQIKPIPFEAVYHVVFSDKREWKSGDWKLYRYD